MGEELKLLERPGRELIGNTGSIMMATNPGRNISILIPGCCAGKFSTKSLDENVTSRLQLYKQ